MELVPYLRSFKGRAESPDSIEYKIGEIFSEIGNKFQSGYSYAMPSNSSTPSNFVPSNKHELSALYEEKIKRMGNAAQRGRILHPTPLIRAMVKVTNPRIGERVGDPACGSAGFLCEAYDHLRSSDLTADQLATLQTRTLYGKEKKPSPTSSAS